MDYRKAKRAFNDQRQHTKGRRDVDGNAIEFRLTFEEWADIWVESGQWAFRGNRKGCHCMCRKNDRGHYEVGNVYIGLHSDNTRDGRTGRSFSHTEEAKRKIAEAGRGRVFSQETRDKIRKANTGNVPSQETREKLRKLNKGVPKKRVTCDICGLETTPQNLSRHVKSRHERPDGETRPLGE